MQSISVMSIGGLLAVAAVSLGGATLSTQPAHAQLLGDDWCGDVTVRFFAGGAEGDAFGSIVQAGAEQAAIDTGANLELVFSDWQSELMVQQMREAVALGVDAIGMMGHPGNAALLPIAEDAAESGIPVMYQNVDVADVRRATGGGYVGVLDLHGQGVALAAEAIRRFDLGEGNTALVFVPLGQEERGLRERGAVEAFEAVGMTVQVVDARTEYASDPNIAIPIISAALAANPDLDLIAYPGGQMLGNAPTYMEVAGMEPGDVINIGFDTSPQIIDGFERGYVQLTSDQQPFLQGYLPVLSLCQQIVLGLGPLLQDTGAGFVTPDNYTVVGDLAQRGLR